MGGAAGFFLELMLFIGFKYKLNMTKWLGHGNPLHLAYSAQYSTARSYPRLHRAWNCQQRGSKSTVSHKNHNNCVQNPKVSCNSSVTSYIISSAFVWKGVPWNPWNPSWIHHCISHEGDNRVNVSNDSQWEDKSLSILPPRWVSAHESISALWQSWWCSWNLCEHLSLELNF